MDDIPELQLDQIAARLESCAICLGYLTDSGRYEIRDAIDPECRALFAMLVRTGSDGEARAINLATNHPNPWVRYHLSVCISRDFKAIALKVFEDLQSVEGFVAASAMLALHHLRKQKH